MGADMSTSVRRLATPINTTTVPAASNSAVVDHWGQVIAVAQPTFDMMAKLRDVRGPLKDAEVATIRAWRHRHFGDSVGGDDHDDDEVDDHDDDEVDDHDDYEVVRQNYLHALVALDWLPEAKQLFEAAACRSAPEAWYYLAIGAMLRGMPNAKGVAPEYSSIVVDMLLYDHDTQEPGCEPGYSAPIFISALRKVRRDTEFVPSAAEILKACVLYRKQFSDLADEVRGLIGERERIEKQIREEAHRKALYAKNGWPDDDSDLPF
jgi:hypothetical protein